MHSLPGSAVCSSQVVVDAVCADLPSNAADCGSLGAADASLASVMVDSANQPPSPDQARAAAMGWKAVNRNKRHWKDKVMDTDPEEFDVGADVSASDLALEDWESRAHSMDGLVERLARKMSTTRDNREAAMLGKLINKRLVRELKRRRCGGRSASSTDEDEDDSKCSKGFNGLRKMRAEFDRKPLRQLEQDLDEIRLRLGIKSERQYWRLRDWSRRLRLQFATKTSLYQMHVCCTSMP